MKITVTATQDGLTEAQLGAARAYLAMKKPTAVIHGGCVGGDDQLDQVCVELGIYRIIAPQSKLPEKRVPDHVFRARGGRLTILEASPDPIDRNHAMVDLGDGVMACPKEEVETIRSGTWATVRYARKKRKLKRIVYPTGWVSEP